MKKLMWKQNQSQGITFSVAGYVIVSILLFHSGPLRAQVVNQSDTAKIITQNTQTVVDSLLIRNIHLIGRQEGNNNILINLLIIKGKLNLVTQDEIPKTKTRITVDGQNGFLMGNLLIGESPSFLILDQNPQENYEIYLNTEAHLLFAMEKGVIVRNNLPLTHVTGDAREKRDGWAAYTPPPMAVPLNYFDNTKWNKFDTKFISGLFNGALVLDRLEWLSQDDASETQVGDLSTSSIGVIRGLRFGLVGTFNFKRPWVYTVIGATRAFANGFGESDKSSFAFYDVRLDIPLFSNVNMSIGKQKEPISLERMTMLIFLPMQERSATVDALLTPRNWGIVFNGTAFVGRSTWAVGAFNNWIDSGASFGDNSYQITGRATAIPYLSADESNLLHLGMGLRYSDFKAEVNGKTEAEFYQSPVFVETGLFSAEASFTCNLEAFWRKGPFLLGGEYTGVHVNSSVYDNPRIHGYNVGVSWVITGEMRPYRKKSGIFNPVPVSKPVNTGGWGAWEVAFRFSTLDLSDGTLDGGIMDTYSFGLNWWLTPRAQFSPNYRYIILDRSGEKGKSSGINIRLSFILD
jgi:phosphate-selective porin OprO/OprP